MTGKNPEPKNESKASDVPHGRRISPKHLKAYKEARAKGLAVEFFEEPTKPGAGNASAIAIAGAALAAAGAAVFFASKQIAKGAADAMRAASGG